MGKLNSLHIKHLIFQSLIFGVFLVTTLEVAAQNQLFLPKIDTLHLEYRSNGAKLHQVDQKLLGTINTRPSAGYAEFYEHNLAKNLFHNSMGLQYLQNNHPVDVKFSGLPYLGFQYGFGAALNQAVNVDFHQFYSDSTHLHFRYHRRTSNGLIRQGDFTTNDLNLKLFHQNENYKTKIDFYYAGYDNAENGGVSDFNVINAQGLDFAPVYLNNSITEIRKVDFKWDNYWSLIGDSTKNHGVVSKSNYTYTDKTYQNDFGENEIFSDVFIDSNKTYDQYKTPSISNGIGYFFNTKFMAFEGTINHKYWRYSNLDIKRDTTEVFLQGSLWLGWEKLYLLNEFYMNTLGALGEIANNASLTFQPNKKVKINGELNFENRLPLPHQRVYMANNTNWNLNDLQNQQYLNINGKVSYGDTNKISAKLDLTSVNNGLYFIDNQLRQDTLEFVSVGSLSFMGELHSKKWHFYPSVTLRFNTDNFNFQPAFSTMNRIAFQTGLFAAKKLKLALALDLGFDSGHRHLMYNPLTNSMDPHSFNSSTPDLLRINFMTGLEIDQFRFFIRAENIDYFINENTSRIDPNYPITPFIVRLGITWDFFN